MPMKKKKTKQRKKTEKKKNLISDRNRWEKVEPRHTTIEEVNEELFKSNISNLQGKARGTNLINIRITNFEAPKEEIKIEEEEKQDMREYMVRLNMKDLLKKVVYEFKCINNEIQSNE